MNPLLMKLLARLMAPASDEGTDTGGTDTGVIDDPAAAGGAEDRGDDFTPTSEGGTSQASGEGEAGAGGQAGEGAADGEQRGAGGVEGAEEDHAQRSPGIPKARFNEVNERKKALETENEQLKRDLEEARAARAPAPAPTPAPGTQEAAPFDVIAKEQEYAAALIEGDTAKAAKIRGDINTHIISEAETRADARAQARGHEQLLKDEVAATLAAHPWLDSDDGADALELIVAARDRAIAQGVAPHQALRNAVAKIAPKFAPAAPPPSGDLSGDSKPVDTRSAEAVKRGAADSVAQPPAVQAGIGNRATPAAKVDIEAMDDAQFAALSPAEKSRLRGD